MFVIIKVENTVENTVPRAYVVSDLSGEQILGTFYEKELQKNKLKIV